MKLLTINAHSLVEDNYNEKLEDFVLAISEEQPDIIALQEVNQSIAAKMVSEEKLKSYVPCGTVPVREDNHAYNAVKRLAEKGIKYYWTWLGIKTGYERFEEGIGLLSKSRIIESDMLTVSGVDDYNNWKTRKVIGICTEEYSDSRFYSVHLGWWEDAQEPFSKQWKKLNSHNFGKEKVWLMGDFNSPAHIRNQGYDLIKDAGWYDSFILAEEKDSGITVGGIIDGWQEKKTGGEGMRIDQIWCSEKTDVISSQVIFNGSNRPVISDHYGVIIETKD